MLDFGNVVTAMVTPFNEDGSLDLEAAVRLAKYLVAHGTDTILVSGTTGESPTLSKDEKMVLLKTLKDSVSVPIMVGSSSNDTADSVITSQLAEKNGADALLLVVPYYNKPNAKGLTMHFQSIARSTHLPCMLYNIPGRTGINMDVETIVALSEEKNIIGLKAASGNLDQITRVRLQTSPSFSIYSGDDALTLPILSLGGRGVVSVASNVIGNPIQKMVSAYHEADIQAAQKEFLYLYPFFKAMFVESNPIPVKYAASLLGLLKPIFRLPMIDPDEDTKLYIEEMMHRYQLI